MTRAFIDHLEPRKLLTNVAFEIDRDASQLAIDAEIDVDGLGDVDLDPQEDGLDVAQVAGTITASITKAGVRFYSGNTIDLVEHDGEFSPGDSSAAWAIDGKVKKLGITLAEADAAFRSVSFDLSNTSRGKVDKKTKRFDLKNATLKTTDGFIDYQLDSKVGDADGTQPMTDLASRIDRTRAKLTGGAGDRAITIPVNVEFEEEVDEGTLKFTITGRIVGREKASAQSATAAAATFSTQSIVRRNVDHVLA